MKTQRWLAQKHHSSGWEETKLFLLLLPFLDQCLTCPASCLLLLILFIFLHAPPASPPPAPPFPSPILPILCHLRGWIPSWFCLSWQPTSRGDWACSFLCVCMRVRVCARVRRCMRPACLCVRAHGWLHKPVSLDYSQMATAAVSLCAFISVMFLCIFSFPGALTGLFIFLCNQYPHHQVVRWYLGIPYI